MALQVAVFKASTPSAEYCDAQARLAGRECHARICWLAATSATAYAGLRGRLAWKNWSERQDLNLRPPRPERGAIHEHP